MAEKGLPDWERIEVDYRAGIKTLREIAEEHGITHGAINKRAKRDGWVRDLTAKIKAKAEELVSKSLVSNEVSKERRILESDIVNTNALNNATIQINERKDVSKTRSIAMSLLAELESQVANKELYERLGELLESPDDKGVDKLNEIYHKVISFGGRTDSMKKLSDTLKTLIDLERRVYKIDDSADEENKSQKVCESLVSGYPMTSCLPSAPPQSIRYQHLHMI